METTTPPPVTQSASGTEDKTVAILSYLTLLGFIIAIVLHSSKKTRLGAFHLRQTLGLFLTGIGFGICQFILMFIPFLGWLVVFALWISFLVLWVMGLIAAINGEMKPIPVAGPLYQKWFGNAFD